MNREPYREILLIRLFLRLYGFSAAEAFFLIF